MSDCALSKALAIAKAALAASEANNEALANAVAASANAAAASANAAAASSAAAAAFAVEAADDKRKREVWEPEHQFFMKHKCIQAEHKPALGQLVGESMRMVHALLSNSTVSSPIHEVGVTSERLEKDIEIVFKASRHQFRNSFCHGWTLPSLDRTIFIDSLFLTRLAY